MRDEKTLDELRGGCYSAMTALTKKAADEKRAMTTEENGQWEKHYAEMRSYEAEISKLEELMEAPDLFTKEPVKFRKASEMLADRQTQLAKAEEEWLALADRA